MPPSFTRAEIKIEDGPTIKCWLNPKKIEVSKSNTWNRKAAAGQSLPAPQFGGGGPQTMSVEVVLDKSVQVPGQTVRRTVDDLFSAMEAKLTKQMPMGGGGGAGGRSRSGGGAQNTNNKRPPTMTFSWGRLMPPFTATCESLKISYDLFDPTGEPLRAVATLGLSQAAPSSAAGQGTNPTTRAVPGIGSHVVKDGDSLPSLAYSYYGDATNWRPIAEANGLDNPLRLRRGQAVFIPRID